MEITKEQVIDILEKFDFFQGQRAGRELWNSKPKEVQDEDTFNFSKDVALLKEYIADVVPRSEYDKLLKQFEALDIECERLEKVEENYHKAKTDVAKQIFAKIDDYIQCFEELPLYDFKDLKNDISKLKNEQIGEVK